jgi:hypothetical protein
LVKHHYNILFIYFKSASSLAKKTPAVLPGKKIKNKEEEERRKAEEGKNQVEKKKFYEDQQCLKN